MLRVLHCVVGMNRGGLETFIMNVYRQLDRSSVQFDFLVSLEGVYDEEIERLGGRVHRVPFISRVGPFAYAAGLHRFFAAHPEYCVVHIHMDRFGGMVAREAARSGVPVRIVHSHSTRNEGGPAVRLVKNYYGRLIPRWATVRMACGKDAARWMFGETPGVVIAPNGVDLALFTPKDRRDAARLTVGHVGRMDRVKNHGFLLEVFAALCKATPSARLRLAGDGPLRPALEEKVRTLGLAGRVEFMGVTGDVAGFLQTLDVFCLPSRHEGLPVSLVEAQACGVPCLVADTVSREADIVGGMEFLGLDAPPEAWARRLLAQRHAPRKKNAAALEAAGYSIAYTARQLEALYKQEARLA